MTSRSSSGGCHLWVQSGSRLLLAAAQCVPARATWLHRGPLPFSPPLRWKVFLASSLPTARHASSSFTSGVQEGKKKDSSLPQKPSAFPAAQASPLCLGCALASEGGSQPALPPACSRPRAERRLEAAPKLAATWGHQPCSDLLWDTLVSCGIASSKTTAGQVAAAWDLGVSVDGSQGGQG